MEVPWSANLLTSPALDLRPESQTDSEILRRLQDIETLKAAISRLQESQVRAYANSARTPS